MTRDAPDSALPGPQDELDPATEAEAETRQEENRNEEDALVDAEEETDRAQQDATDAKADRSASPASNPTDR